MLIEEAERRPECVAAPVRRSNISSDNPPNYAAQCHITAAVSMITCYRLRATTVKPYITLVSHIEHAVGMMACTSSLPFACTLPPHLPPLVIYGSQRTQQGGTHLTVLG